MSKERSSIRGRGDEIIGRGVDALFSSPATPAAPPTGEPGAPTAAETTLDQMLSKEARAATTGSPPAPPGPAPAGPPSVAGQGVLVSDDELLQNIDVPLGGRETPTATPSAAEIPPPAPIAPRPLPPTPPPSVRPASPTPSPSLPGAETTLPSRPRITIGGALTEVPLPPSDLDAGLGRPPSPFDTRPPVIIDDVAPPPRPPDVEQRLLAKIDKKRIQDLNGQIDQLYLNIPERMSNRPDVSGQAMGLLRQARTILFERPQDFVEAEYKVRQAELIYNRVENAEKWGDTYGWRVFWYEIIILALFVLSFLSLLAFGKEFSDFLARIVKAESSRNVFTAVGFWATFVWGGIGGVVGSLYILWMHVSERQDFERQHVMWYTVQPILGLILGGVTFLIIYTGLLSLQGAQGAATSLAQEIQLFPCLIAFIAGFRPQFVFGLLTKIIKLINPSENEQGAGA